PYGVRAPLRDGRREQLPLAVGGAGSALRRLTRLARLPRSSGLVRRVVALGQVLPRVLVLGLWLLWLLRAGCRCGHGCGARR
ncbi:hypothetical protein, partial [Streptomyces sp. B188M101]|uniref:hypothetical protein n=1 Tax=Streptomyces sp. B188M101 TaxID=1736042 RepID=UPI0015E18699